MAAHRHGAARIAAALSVAPAAACLFLFGLLALLPLPADVATLIGFLAVGPVACVASSLALLSWSGTRAWAGSTLVAALGTLALVLS